MNGKETLGIVSKVSTAYKDDIPTHNVQGSISDCENAQPKHTKENKMVSCSVFLA